MARRRRGTPGGGGAGPGKGGGKGGQGGGQGGGRGGAGRGGVGRGGGRGSGRPDQRGAGEGASGPGRRGRGRGNKPLGPPPSRSDVSRPTRGAERLPEIAEQCELVYVDEQIVVVNKPPDLTTMRHPGEAAEFGPRARRFLPPTLQDLLPQILERRGLGGRPRAVHRLDKETSGLVVFARSPEAEGSLGKQLRAHSMDREYWAVVRGAAREATIESWLVRDRGDGRRGSWRPPETASEARPPRDAQRAVTHVRVVERLGDFTLVACRLETGRTHQIRIHLGEAGTPLCGERIYDRPLHGRPLPDSSRADRIALHAATLGLTHPATGRRLKWESPLPADLRRLIDHLRSTRA